MEMFRSKATSVAATVTLSDRDSEKPASSSPLDEARLAVAAATAADAGRSGRYFVHPRFFEGTKYAVQFDPGLAPLPDQAAEAVRQAIVKAAAARGAGRTMSELSRRPGLDDQAAPDEEDTDVAE